MDICEKGPEEKLTSTDIAQPALFVVFAIHCQFSKSKNVIPEVVAEQSLGEYSAPFSGGVFSFEDGIRLTQKRGSLMENVSQRPAGKMLAVVGLGSEKASTLIFEAQEVGVIVYANFNSFDQVALSGIQQQKQLYL